MHSILLIFAGLALLLGGGEALVRGAVQIAGRLGLSPLVIGLTIVGFGTSTPELVTSIEAALIGAPGIAVGNVVGSNIANILLILGAAVLLAPTKYVQQRIDKLRKLSRALQEEAAADPLFRAVQPRHIYTLRELD